MTEYAKKLLRLYHEQSKKNRTIQGSPPLTFKGKGKDLKNYRIYGNTVNGENVGDLITEGEHAGEYSVPVTVTNGTDTETTNLYLPEQIKMVGDEAEYVDYKEQKQHRVRKNLLPKITATYSGDGILLISESDGTVSVNGIATETVFLRLKSDVSYPFDTILSGCAQGGSREGYYLRAQSTLQTLYSDYGNGALIPANTQVFIEIRIQKGTECNNLEFKPMIRKADIEDDTYEPYIEDTDLDVTLPALPTLSGTNTLTVGTEVQPSKVYIKGEFKKITTTYVQSIEPDNTNNKIIFVVRAYRSKNDRMVRAGLVATNDPAIGVNINVNSTVITSGCKVFVKEVAGVTPTTNNIKYEWTKTKVTDGEIWYVRSYVEYINSDNEQLIIYSDAAKASLDGII